MSGIRQPLWKLVGNLGDVDPVEYGGRFIYVDRRKVYAPELELLEPTDGGETAPAPWIVYRLVLEPHTLTPVDGGPAILSDNPFHPLMPVWYADKLDQVAESSGTTAEDIRAGLLSSDPVHRAGAYGILVDYFGPTEFDQYPRTYNKRSQLPRRIRRYGEG